jgi:hypothetical protein
MSTAPQQSPRWRRFWCEPDANVALGQDGFLIASVGEGAYRFVPSELRTLEQLEEKRCLVLLGQPGIGKSEALRDEESRLRAASADVLRVDLASTREESRLQRMLFESSQFLSWASGDGELYFLLDSLDEARLHIPVIGLILMDGLREVDFSRIRLRVTCRTADRLDTLEGDLKQLWGEDDFGMLELAPLTRDDIAAAATNRGLDAEGFIAAVRARGVGPFAARPLTLNMLLAEADTEAGLPDSQIELYDRALLQLVREPGEQRAHDRLLGPGVEPRARIAIAARVAAATVLSGRARISAADSAIPTSDAVTLRELGGGEEVDDLAALQTRVGVTDDALREVLDSALFSARGSELGFAHQTYAEHLAARYITRTNIPVDTALTMLGSTETDPRITPQLRDLAGAAAGMSPALFDELVVRDPLALLRGDLTHAAHEQKRALTHALLDSELVPEIHTHEAREQRALAKLSYEGMQDDLRPCLGTGQPPPVRQLAYRLVELCGLTGLDGDLLAVALDATEEQRYTRVQAIRALGASDDPDVLRALIPLARDAIDEDENDDLKAAALSAVCPAVVPVSDVFSYLTARKERSYFGGYASFLSFEMPRLLQDSDLPAGLRWIQGLPPHEDPTDSFSRWSSHGRFNTSTSPGLPTISPRR